MAIDIKVPTVGESISEVTLVKWLKNDGDYVERDEVIAELDGMARLVEEMLSPQSHADIREIAGLVDELLRKLPEEQRLTFHMHHYLGMTLVEVADAMEANVPTTKSRLRLAREKLQEFLRGRGIDGA